MLAAIALGSNLPSPFGAPDANVQEALRRLRSLGEVMAVSRFYETAPVGYTEQPHFTNAAVLLKTDLGPQELLRALLALEQGMGRRRPADQPPKGPRVIDLDFLLYEGAEGKSLILRDPDLILPHPEMSRRLFVLEPLAEIAADMRDPVSGRTVEEMLNQLRS